MAPGLGGGPRRSPQTKPSPAMPRPVTPQRGMAVRTVETPAGLQSHTGPLSRPHSAARPAWSAPTLQAPVAMTDPCTGEQALLWSPSRGGPHYRVWGAGARTTETGCRGGSLRAAGRRPSICWERPGRSTRGCPGCGLARGKQGRGDARGVCTARRGTGISRTEATRYRGAVAWGEHGASNRADPRHSRLRSLSCVS